MTVKIDPNSVVDLETLARAPNNAFKDIPIDGGIARARAFLKELAASFPPATEE